MNAYKALLLLTFFTLICSDITYTSAYTYSTKDCFANGNVSSSKADENVILVKDGGNFSMTNINVNKAGDASDLDNANLYGINAAFLVLNSSTSTIYESTITTNGKGANALFADGDKSKIIIAESTITTKGSNSGLLATNSGTINPYRLEISTSGDSSPSLATNNSGVIICEWCKALTEGKDSPIVYSKGSIYLAYLNGSALNSQMIVIDGPNTVKLRDSELSSSSNSAGIFIYQSSERNGNEGRARFLTSDSSFTITDNSAPMFYVTNTKVDIILLGNNNFKTESGVFLKVESNENWGTSGNNGGEVSLYATNNQAIKGDIICGANSTISIYLTEYSYILGKITIIDNGIVNIYFDSSGVWELTGDSTVTNYQYNNEYNIDKKGFTLTGTVVNTLQSQSELPESTYLHIDSISDTNVTCTNKVPSGNNDDDDDDFDDDDDGDSSKAKFIYINLLSLLFLILHL